ncbi:thioester dehydrase [Helicobacter sp. MIT 99-5507]|uniref:ApeP family dehydratase n=1 Tax=Helicobacter sp. MIT 99-5507 TaxID=152489 RepID=UPI000E1F8473|nr:thioester dehydrase [Helicobacter sp. MIT 99-5507]RDU56715.1 thioester dehydrase [Helicobacter sp. MIT 99-5507]
MYVRELMPHSGDMVLIDSIVERRNDFISTKTIINKDNPFLENNLFPAFNTLEIMAQSLVVFRGLSDKSSSFRLGFLLGARKFEIYKPYLKIKDELITKTIISEDFNGMGVYESSVFVNDELVASANISLFNPSKEQLDEILKASNE